eukprot:6184309-Pleurochrysis_carterae.AAC.4
MPPRAKTNDQKVHRLQRHFSVASFFELRSFAQHLCSISYSLWFIVMVIQGMQSRIASNGITSDYSEYRPPFGWLNVVNALSVLLLVVKTSGYAHAFSGYTSKHLAVHDLAHILPVIRSALDPAPLLA